MFTNDKHSRKLRPVALDTDFFLCPHPYIWAEVLLQAPKWFLNHLFFNSRWTLSIIFPAHPQHVALPEELSWRLLVIGCQGPFGPFPRESQKLLSDPSQISSYVIYEAKTTDFALHPEIEMVYRTTQMLHSPGHCPTGVLQIFRQWIAGRKYFTHLYILCIWNYIIWFEGSL